MEIALLLGSFLLFLLIGLPVAFCLGLSAVITLLSMDISPVIAFQRMISDMNVFALMALPFFIYAGELMTRGGIADRLLTFASAAVGRMRGGLGLVNVSSSMLFGGISAGGSVSVASLFLAGLLPVMEKIGMDPVQFGVMLILNLGIGLITPPVGSVLFVGCAIGKTRIEDAVKSLWPFYLALLMALMLITFIPAISLALPRWLNV